MKRFWNFVRNDEGERILRLEGPIDEDNFWGDEVTPKQFRTELEAEEGDVTVYINSPGGNVFAAAEIYTMLLEHKGNITVKIDAIAASAASVIAMAGTQVLMSPVAMLMIHDPMTIAMGNAKDMEKAIDTLNEVKESIINAYHLKSGLNRKKISQLMQDETWMNARKAVELGFADGVIGRMAPAAEESEEEKTNGEEIEAGWQPYSTRAMGQRVLNWLVPANQESADADEESAEAETDAQDVESAETGLIEQINMFEETLPENRPDLDKNKGELDENEVESKDPESETKYVEPETRDEKQQEEAAPVAEDVPSTEDAETENVEAKAPVIGMDGKTADGAMPFEILKKQLDFLK